MPLRRSSRFLFLCTAALACEAQSTSGAGGSDSHEAVASTTSSTTATSSTSGGATDAGLTCDDMGFCGEANDPGCQGCALTEGSCADELQRCQDAPSMACVELNHCYLECPEDDLFCHKGCEDQFPAGVAPLSELAACVYCDECRISCNVQPDSCPE